MLLKVPTKLITTDILRILKSSPKCHGMMAKVKIYSFAVPITIMLLCGLVNNPELIQCYELS